MRNQGFDSPFRLQCIRGVNGSMRRFHRRGEGSSPSGYSNSNCGDSWYKLRMQIAPLLLGGAALFAFTRKKKRKVSTVPKVERFGRVERLLNVAAIEQSHQQWLDAGMPSLPTVVFYYVPNTPSLEKVTLAMVAQAQMFQNVEFYQVPVAALARISGQKVALAKGSSGYLGAARGLLEPEGAFIFPNDDPQTIATKVARQVLYATTGKRVEA